MPMNSITGFHLQNALTSPGGDRAGLNNNLGTTMNMLGLGTNVAGFSWDKADVLAHSIGLNLEQFLPNVSILGKRVGVVGLGISGAGMAIDGVQVGLAFAENGFSFDSAGWSGVQLALGLTTAVGALRYQRLGSPM